MQEEGHRIGTEVQGKFFTIFVDGKEFHVEESSLTGGQIMDLAGISREAGLILVLEDGTQVQVKADEVIELKPGRRFKKAPRFIRG
ncbi:MAG: multiubiquitin domain-containing protein [Candidatus Omnitrophica bacterium]|nr:multiubiquitin domain-containing protein [Candidatus Omnitrophota bacterium]